MIKFLRTIKTAYTNLTSPAKASIWFIFCNVIQKSMYFLMIPAYTRLMSTQEFGIYSVYTSWVSLVSIFAGLNLAGNSYNVGMTRYDKDQDRYTSSMTGLWWFHTTIWLLFAVLLKDFWTKYTGLSFSILLAVFVHIYAEGGYDLWGAKHRFDFQYRSLAFITVLFVLCNLIIGILSVSLSADKALAAIWAKAGVLIVFGALSGLWNLKSGKTLIYIPYWKKALSFNIPLIAYYLSLMILNQSDRLMINAICGSSQAGIYSIAYSLATVLSILTGAINAAFTPWEFRSIKNRKIKPIQNVAVLFVAIIGFVNLILIAVAPEIIYFVTTPEYYEAIWVIPPVAFSMVITCLYSLFINIEFYYEKNYFVMAASVFVALLNVILNAIMIPLFGFLAAAYTTLISYSCFAIVHYIFMLKTCRQMGQKENIYNIRLFLIIIFSVCILVFTFFLLYEKVILRYALLTLILISMCVYIISGKYKPVLNLLTVHSDENN